MRLVVLIAALLRLTGAAQPAPAAAHSVAVVFLHGLADTRNRSGYPASPALFHFGDTASLAQATREALPDAYVVNAVYGDRGDTGDQTFGITGRFEDIVKATCAQLTDDARLVASPRVHLVGISEGALALRAMLQHPACDKLRAVSLISMAGPQAGISALPFCLPLTAEESGAPCRQIMQLIRAGVYSAQAQSSLLPFQYFMDPSLTLPDFAAKGTWIGQVNGWGPAASQTVYAKQRILSLEQMVLFRFEKDTVVVPRDSSWFAYLSGTRLLQLWEQPGWAEDVLGLRALKESGRLLLLTAPGQHCTFGLPWFRDHVVPFLN